MKTKNLLKVLSLAVLLGGLAKVSSFSDFRSSGSELFLESTQGTDMFDDCQEGLRLQGPRRAQETGDLLASDVKVQISDVDENGNRSIRYVAAISSLAVDASFERTIYNEDGSVFAESSVKAVQYAYESIIANGEEVLPSSFGEGYNYFIVYTLGNVPESHWYHRIDVSVSVNEEESSRQANVEGVVKGYVQDSNLVYSETGSDSGEYQVSAASTDITSANISDYYVKYNDIVATRGKVTSIARRGFQNCNNLEQLTIPSTITYFDDMCFDGVSYIEEVRYYAASATRHSSDTTLMPNLGSMIIGSEVKRLPEGMFVRTSIGNIEYKGTKEQWLDVVNGSALQEVVFSDSKLCTVTFHFEGATLSTTDGLKTDSYSYDIYEGKTISNPGTPEYADGSQFNGWYLDENFETKFSSMLAPTPEEGKEKSELHIYANSASFELGMDIDHPLPIKFGSNDEKTVTEAQPYTYYSFEAPETDYYRFKDVGSASNTGVWVYSLENTTTALASSTSGNFDVRYLLQGGQTYIIKAGSYQSTPKLFNYNYKVEVSTLHGDQLSELNEEDYLTVGSSKIAQLSGKGYYNYYYYDTTNEDNPTQVAVSANSTSFTTNTNVELLNANDPETVLTKSTFVKSKVYSVSFDLEDNQKYIIRVSSDKNSTYDFEFSLSAGDDVKAGSILSKPLDYTSKVTLSSVTGRNNLYDGTNYYADLYFKYTVSSDCTINVNLSAVKDTKGMAINVYEDSLLIDSPYTFSSPLKSKSSTTVNGSVSISAKAGKVYVINVQILQAVGTLNTKANTLEIKAA